MKLSQNLLCRQCLNPYEKGICECGATEFFKQDLPDMLWQVYNKLDKIEGTLNEICRKLNDDSN